MHGRRLCQPAGSLVCAQLARVDTTMYALHAPCDASGSNIVLRAMTAVDGQAEVERRNWCRMRMSALASGERAGGHPDLLTSCATHPVYYRSQRGRTQTGRNSVIGFSLDAILSRVCSRLGPHVDRRRPALDCRSRVAIHEAGEHRI